MSKILVIGSSMYDLVTYAQRMPQGGETLEGQDFKQGFGGKGANQAVAAAKLGADVVMLTALGDDIFGEMTFQNYKNHNIDTDFVHIIKDQPNGVATIIVDEKAQNRILIVKAANNFLTKQKVDEAFEKLNHIQMIVLQLEINLDIVYYVIEKAKQKNIPVLLNPAPAVENLNPDILPLLDIFVPNETELEILTQMPVSTAEETEKAAAYLLEKDVKNIIVTLGSKGALYMSKDDKFYVQAPKVDAIDTTGAGDGFIGAFVQQYTAHNNMKKAIEFAIAYASTSTTMRGTQTSYLSKDAFETSQG